MTEFSVPRFSVLITSYRSLRFLQECLGSVLRSTGPSFELLFLENGSPEPEAEWIARNLPDPRLRVFQVPNTRFFAGGINYLAAHARGDYVVMLNADTRVVPGWLEEIDARLRETGFEGMTADVREMSHPEQAGNHVFSLDTFGLLHYTCMQANAPEPTLVTGGCGMAIRRDVFEELGGLDSDFRMYFEDIDFCWRMALRGYRIGYAPRATVYHVGQGSTLSHGFLWNRFRGRRNRVWAYFKNAGPGMLACFLPVYLVIALGSIFGNLVRGKVRNAIAEVSALAAAFYHIGIPLSKRGVVQRTRVLSDRQLEELGLISAPFHGFWGRFYKRRPVR